MEEGDVRKSRGLPIQISRLIRTTYSVIYWHLCTIPLLQKITFVDRHVAIASRHLLLLLSLSDRNLLLDVWEPPWQGATSPWPALCGRGAEGLLLGKCWHLGGADWLPDASKLHQHCLFCHPEYEMRGREKKTVFLFYFLSKNWDPPTPPFLTTSVFSDKVFLDWARSTPLIENKW